MSSAGTPSRSSRAAARRAWPVRLVALGAEPRARPGRRATAEERLAIVWALTVDAWALGGRAMPVYSRTAAPVRLCRFERRRPETPA